MRVIRVTVFYGDSGDDDDNKDEIMNMSMKQCA